MIEPEVAPKKLTSHDLKIGLRKNKGDGHQVFFEVGNDTGTRVTRHADAVSIGIWPSTGHQICGYEIKVSRGDFFTEMKTPEKSWPIMQYCHRWILLTTPGLIKADELPPNWGLSTFDGKTMRTVKQPPLLTPIPPSAGFMAALVRRAGEVDSQIIAAAQDAVWREAKSQREKEIIERRAKQSVDYRFQEGVDAIATVKAFKEALGENWVNEHAVAEIAAAIKFVRKLRLLGGWDSLQTLIGSIDAASRDLKKALSDVDLPSLGKK